MTTTKTATYRPDLSDTRATYDEHGTGSVCGPEYYAGGEWSRRHIFEHINGTYTVVTEYAAVINADELYNRDPEDDDDRRPYTVEETTEMIDCTDWQDPGGTETHAENVYGEGSMFAYDTVEGAEREAKRYGANMSPDYFTIPNITD